MVVYISILPVKISNMRNTRLKKDSEPSRIIQILKAGM